MKTNGSVYVSAVFAALIGYFSYQWWFNPNRIVKRRLGELAATLSVPANESDLARVARLAQLRQLLADDVRVRAGRSGPELSSRDAVIAAAVGWRPAGGSNVDFVDVDVKVDSNDAARAYVTVDMTTRDSANGSSGARPGSAGVVSSGASGGDTGAYGFGRGERERELSCDCMLKRPPACRDTPRRPQFRRNFFGHSLSFRASFPLSRLRERVGVRASLASVPALSRVGG